VGDDLYQSMVKEIENARKEMKETLYTFFKENPTEDMLNTKNENRDLMAEQEANKLISEIKIPDPHKKWIKDFKLEAYFSDITYEDLKNPTLLKELKEKGLIDKEDETSLADFGKGIKVQQSQMNFG